MERPCKKITGRTRAACASPPPPSGKDWGVFGNGRVAGWRATSLAHRGAQCPRKPRSPSLRREPQPSGGRPRPTANAGQSGMKARMRCWHSRTATEFGRNPASFGRCRANFCRNRGIVCQIRANLARCRAKSADSEPNLAAFGPVCVRIRPKFGRLGPLLDRSRAKFGRFRAKSCRTWLNSVDSGPIRPIFENLHGLVPERDLSKLSHRHAS